MYALAHAIFKC